MSLPIDPAVGTADLALAFITASLQTTSRIWTKEMCIAVMMRRMMTRRWRKVRPT